MKWNAHAWLRLGILGLIFVPGLALIILFPSGGFYWVLLVLLSWLGCYVSWSFQVMKGLQDQVLQNLGFASDNGPSTLEKYGIGHNYCLRVWSSYLPSQQYPMKLSCFTLNNLYTKSNHSVSYVGCEFETTYTHNAVQVYDCTDPYKPLLDEKRQLEGNEFNNAFTVYSQDPKAPFYFLDPDTMSDLIDIQKTTKLFFNIASFENSIIVYARNRNFTNILQLNVSAQEVFTGIVDTNKMPLYQQKAERFFAEMQQIFALLDYKLKN